jgi:hypothetical protein
VSEKRRAPEDSFASIDKDDLWRVKQHCGTWQSAKRNGVWYVQFSNGHERAATAAETLAFDTHNSTGRNWP